MEEFSLMFQETVARNVSEVDAAPGRVVARYEGLQSSSSLNCSDLLKLFDQSGTTSPKRIFFLLTCIELPEQFDRINELKPLLARGRIQHFHLEDPSAESMDAYLLQYFYPQDRRNNLSAAERQRLDEYSVQMRSRLGAESTNWHAVKKHAQVYPLSRH